MSSSDPRLLDVNLPREVWSRSGRPGRSLLFRALLTLTIALIGLALPSPALAWGMVALGVAAFFGVPVLVDGRLEKLGETVRAAGRSEAADLLASLESRRLVTMFGPFAWLELQRARLLLIQGDGRGAARALAECARMCREPKQPVLLGAQARAYTLSGDRKEARALLVELDGLGKLDARGHLDLAIAYLADTGRAGKAQSHLDAAAGELGEHPQVTAARATALAREGGVDDAAELLEAAEDAAADDDPIAAELIKRARKLVKNAAPAKSKGKKAKAASEGTSSGAGKGKRKKKDRRKERREKRKAARASGPQPTTVSSGEMSLPEPAPPSAEDLSEAQAEFVARAEADTLPEGTMVPVVLPGETPREPAPAQSPAEAAPASEPAADAKPAEPESKPAPASKPLFASPSQGGLFRPPPVPKIAAPPSTGAKPSGGLFAKADTPTVTKPVAKPAAAKPAVAKPATPKIAPPPVVAPKPPSVGGAAGDDGWDDLLGD